MTALFILTRYHLPLHYGTFKSSGREQRSISIQTDRMGPPSLRYAIRSSKRRSQSVRS